MGYRGDRVGSMKLQDSGKTVSTFSYKLYKLAKSF